MRKASEFSGNLRAMARTGMNFGHRATDELLQGGSGETLPSALAVLAASESRFMFILVKLSGCRENLSKENQHEPEDQARSAVVSGSNS